MADQNQDQRAIKDPGRLDYKKANEGLKKLLRENAKWLKDMARR